MFFCWFFFFKQKTAYEMRISDWSSDVCSSDLRRQRFTLADGIEPRPRELACQQHRCAFKLWLGRAQPDVVTGAKRDTVQHQTFGVQRITIDVRVAGRRRGGEIAHRAFMAAARYFGDVDRKRTRLNSRH